MFARVSFKVLHAFFVFLTVDMRTWQKLDPQLGKNVFFPSIRKMFPEINYRSFADLSAG